MIYLDPDRFLSEVATAILGADHSLEVLAPVGALPFEITEFLGIADSRLRLRCLLSLPIGTHVTNDHSLVRLVGSADWDSRFLDATDNFLILLDKESAFQYRDGVFLRNDGLREARALDEMFHTKWEAAHGLERLFSDRTHAGILLATFSPEFWSWLIAELASHPQSLYELTPRRFEELLAELLGRQDFEITLTPPSRDGGRDILARKRDLIGDHLFYVECKRYAPDRPVGVELVRALYGVVEAEQATAGLLVTTSRFTRGARLFQDRVRNRLALQDYEGLQEWLQRHQ